MFHSSDCAFARDGVKCDCSAPPATNSYQKKFAPAIKFLKEFTAEDFDLKSEKPVKVHVPLILRDDETLVSAESNNSFLFADYYGEFRGGYPWVNAELEAGLKKLGFFLEWVNPGCLVLCE